MLVKCVNIYVSVMFLMSCSVSTDVKNIVSNETEIKKVVRTDSIIKLHSFSDRNSLDTFLLTMRNEDLCDSCVHFCVKNKEVLYDIYFNPTFLIPYTSIDDTSATHINFLIKRGFNNFLEEEHFYTPPINLEAKYDSDNDIADYETWKLIKENTSAIAFNFKQLDETSSSIVYIKKLKKVVEF